MDMDESGGFVFGALELEGKGEIGRWDWRNLRGEVSRSDDGEMRSDKYQIWPDNPTHI